MGCVFNPYYDSGYSPKDSPVFTYEQIKAELTAREHIPNKFERRKNRQGLFKNKKIDNILKNYLQYIYIMI